MPMTSRPFRSLVVAAGLGLAAPGALAVHTTPACANDPQAAGLAQRIDNLRDHMRRIEKTQGRPEQRALMDLHLKAMQEGLRELRGRGTTDACRLEILHALMEQMLRLQLAERESADR
jgi:hypothetical protein